MDKCECCGFECDSEVKIGEGEIYKVCLNCMIPLINLNLSPKQFFNLLEHGHKTEEFILHSDFYEEETGEALQPRY